MRAKQISTLLAVTLFVVSTILLLRHPARWKSLHRSKSSGTDQLIRQEILKPLRPPTEDSHPVYKLITKAEKEFEGIKARQSKTLEDAIKEYKLRYKILPPPNFDKWYELAKEKNVQLIDEYDAIYHSLLPFWALQPATIRGRAREALGFDNGLLGILVRNGQVRSVGEGDEWQQKATAGMMKDFLQFLPDMDLAFNIRDEPRVIVPHDDLTRLIKHAKEVSLPAALANTAHWDAWSVRPDDMNDGKRLEEAHTTRFNEFAHQSTWTHSRLSCPPDSPSRSLDESTLDETVSYTFSSLSFISNKTAFSDICLSPSLRNTFGFFDRPNAFQIVHDLFPIFSQSKISSYQDILYPSPWYWSNKVPYDESADPAWANKHDQMYWRGSTTGGFSRHGGWRRQHRQRIVQKMNALDNTKILQNRSTGPGIEAWEVIEVPRQNYTSLFDVHFSSIGQCDKDDCEAQKEFFQVAKAAPQEYAFSYKHLLDIDGNAFSGRFYAFLKSRSLVYKMSLFREWHEDWIRPWVHYIPLGLGGEEYVESVRYFDREEGGKTQAERVAVKGREWAGKVLRNEDLEIFFFRLLLE
ncbi:capsule-associated protein CAP1 [Schaereria dolodes]|nr:capsule-associated protein CAP1 [Schaereria dolodes]